MSDTPGFYAGRTTSGAEWSNFSHDPAGMRAKREATIAAFKELISAAEASFGDDFPGNDPVTHRLWVAIGEARAALRTL